MLVLHKRYTFRFIGLATDQLSTIIHLKFDKKSKWESKMEYVLIFLCFTLRRSSQLPALGREPESENIRYSWKTFVSEMNKVGSYIVYVNRTMK